MANFEPLSRGQIWQPTAAEVNAMLEAGARVRHSQGGEFPTEPRPIGAVEVDVLNASGGAITAQFPILRRTGLCSDHDQLPSTCFHKPVLKGSTPNSTTAAADVIICRRPVHDNHIVKGIINGLASCDLDYTDEAHQFAQPIDGDNTKLKSATSGLRIEAREKDGTTGSGTLGLQRAVVMIGGGGGGGGSAGTFGIVVEDSVSADGGIGSYVLIDGELTPIDKNGDTLIIDSEDPEFDETLYNDSKHTFTNAHKYVGIPVGARVILHSVTIQTGVHKGDIVQLGMCVDVLDYLFGVAGFDGLTALYVPETGTKAEDIQWGGDYCPPTP